MVASAGLHTPLPRACSKAASAPLASPSLHKHPAHIKCLPLSQGAQNLQCPAKGCMQSLIFQQMAGSLC